MATINFYATGCSYIAHANFTGTDLYPSGIPCPITGVKNITGTVTIRASEVYFDSGYGFPAYVYVNGTQVDYLQSTQVSFSSSGVTNVQVVATRQNTKPQGTVYISRGTGISRIYYQYCVQGTWYSSSSTASEFAVSADQGSDINIYNYTFASNYGLPTTFQEYTNRNYNVTTGTPWTSDTDTKIRVKSTYRYMKLTASAVQSTYYGRITLNANGGRFTTNTSTTLSWPVNSVMSNTGVGSAYVSTNLPTSGSSYIPVYSGYTFVGWATDSGATTPNHYSGETVGFTARSTSSSSPTNLTLYAVWRKVYTLSYATTLSGVSNMPSSSTISGAGYIMCSSTIPVKSGYTFLGWADSAGGAVKYVGGTNIYVSADKTVYAVFEKITLSSFYWTGSSSTDSAKIAKGQPVSNLTATSWNNYRSTLLELANLVGASASISTASSGSTITATMFNQARNGLVNIKAQVGGSTQIPDTVAKGDTILASMFVGVGSLRNALNGLISLYNAQ